jgi:hypothetical protein
VEANAPLQLEIGIAISLWLLFMTVMVMSAIWPKGTQSGRQR